jgi:hypothetical protein
MVQFALFSAKSENVATRLGYHAFFVRAIDAATGWPPRNHALIRRVSLFFEFDLQGILPRPL